MDGHRVLHTMSAWGDSWWAEAPSQIFVADRHTISFVFIF